MNVAIIDYGRGNIHSVAKAVAHLGGNPVVTADPVELGRQDLALLPGVGAFTDAVAALAAARLDAGIRSFASTGKPLLGICLGMQVLLSRGEEGGAAAGLGLIPGRTRLLAAGDGKLPHIGWNTVELLRPSPLTAGLPGGAHFYFAHSYAAFPEAEDDWIGSAVHGERFAAIAGRGNVWGTQFHPEKSGREGLRLLSNFLRLGGEGRHACEAADPLS